MGGIQASVMSGPTTLMALQHPFVGPTGPTVDEKPVMGVPWLIDIFSREVIMFDPWALKDAGIINSAYGIFLGPKGHGKSTAMKTLAHRLMLLPAGYDMMKIAINDYKPEGKGSEYELFAKKHRSKPFRIAEAEVNPLESRLFSPPGSGVYEAGVVRMAEMLCRYGNNGTLTSVQAEAMRVSVYMMLTMRELAWSPRTLQQCTFRITRTDIDNYKRTLKGKLYHQVENRLVRIDNSYIRKAVFRDLRSLTNRSDNTSYEEIISAGVQVGAMLGNLLDGSFGRMFGSKYSLYEMMTQRATTYDWRGVSREAETLMRIILTEVKVAAIETNRLDLVPHIELDDERHKSMGNLFYAQSTSYFSEIARGVHTCNLSATHRLSSIRKGGVGSELYMLGDTIINNNGFIAIGRHKPNDETLKELQDMHDISSPDLIKITTMPRRTFAIKLGDEQRIRFGQTFVLPSELDFQMTDSATDRMLDRPNLLNPETLERFARQNGIVYLGRDAA